MSDTELDAELLALAGGDDESIAGDITQFDAGGSRPASPSASPPPADEPRQTPPPARRGVATGKKVARAGAKKRRKSDSEEEGEASSGPGTPESDGSAAMDESSGGSPDASGSEDEMMFPIEGKFRNEKDRAAIMAMPEMEREMILADRAAESERQQQDLHLKRLLQQREREEAGKKKRKAGLADLDDSTRKSSRPKTKTSEALETYKRAREERTSKKPRDTRKKGHQRSLSHSGSETSEVHVCPECGQRDLVDTCGWCNYDPKESPEERARKNKKINESIARERAFGKRPGTLDEYNKVRIGRGYFPQICFYPGFEELATGAFARVCGGIDEATKQPFYRMCKIEGFNTGEPYHIQNEAGRPVFVDQYAVLRYGKTDKVFRFDTCSNGSFTEDEFNRYRRACADAGMKEELATELHDKCDDIARFLERQWTYAEIQKKLAKQDKYRELTIGKLEEQLARDRAANPHVQTMSRLEERNRANRKLNEQTARRAQLDAMKEQRRRRKMAEIRERRQQEEVKAKLLAVPKDGDAVDDLFGEGGSEISRAATPVGKDEKKKADKPAVKREKVNGIPTFLKRNMDDELIGAMDLGIDIEI